MRRLILYILLLAFSTASSQVDYFATQTKANGTRIGMVEHVAPDNPDGTRPGVMVWLHGIEANKSAPISINDTTRIAIVTGKGPLKLVLSNPLPLFKIPGTNKYARWSIVAPQNRTGEWDCECVTKTFEYIRANTAKFDTSLIIIVGYSLGGGGVQTCLDVSGVYQYVKYAVAIAPGYTDNANFIFLKDEAIPIDVFSTIGDALAPPTGTERADFFVNSLKAQNPIIVPTHIRMNDISADNSPTDHNLIVQIIAEDTTAGDSYSTTNGGTWTRDETIFHRGLRFKGPRRKHMDFGIPVMFILLINPTRNKSKTLCQAEWIKLFP